MQKIAVSPEKCRMNPKDSIKRNLGEKHMRNRHPELSIIAPAYNEEAVIAEFHRRLAAVLDTLPVSAEILYINDGSRDRTLAILKHLRQTDPRVGVIGFSRNFGKEFATTAGLRHARGQALIVIDSDLQDQPELIPAMLQEWHNGHDVVLMRRTRRRGETFLKKFTARLFYLFIRKISYVQIPDNVGDFRLMSRKVVNALLACNEEVRFMKGLFAWAGFKTAVIEYERDVRAGGHTAFGYWKLWNFALDGITGFSTAPLKIASYLGLLTLVFAAIYAVTQFMVKDAADVYAGIISIIAVLGGLQFLVLGIMGEYLARMAVESKKRPLYIIDEFYRADTNHENALQQTNHVPDDYIAGDTADTAFEPELLPLNGYHRSPLRGNGAQNTGHGQLDNRMV